MGSTGLVIHGDSYFPDLHEQGKLRAQVFKSSPQGGSESMELLYLLSMAAAEKNIRLGSAYFVPDNLTIQALIDAKKRGVSVQIIVPGKFIDEKVVRPASRARWGGLLVLQKLVRRQHRDAIPRADLMAQRTPNAARKIDRANLKCALVAWPRDRADAIDGADTQTRLAARAHVLVEQGQNFRKLLF